MNDEELMAAIRKVRGRVRGTVDPDDALDDLVMHIGAQAAEIARLRAAEVPLSLNAGFAHVDDVGLVWGQGWTNEVWRVAADAVGNASDTDTPVALIPVTAWDRT